MNIAIFGGSFDPIHIAHEKIIFEAFKTLNLDKIILVPTFLNPHKIKSHLDPKERLFLITKNFKNNNKIIVSDYEVNQNRPVYTIETVKFIKQKYNPHKTFLIIGADNYISFNKWHKYEEILKELELVVASRNGFLNQNYDNIKTLNVDIDISSTYLRDNLDLNYIPQKIKEDVKRLWH